MIELKKGTTIDLEQEPPKLNTVYIAGKITNYPEYRKHFQQAVDKMTAAGYLCMNPAELPEGFPWEAYMPICYAMIDACDSIYLLYNWKSSRGAQMEYEYAVAHGKTILYEEVL